MTMKARYYQNDARRMIKAARKAGEPGALIVLPTGTGKTFVMAKEAHDEVRRGGKVLIIAHKKKLLAQTKRALLDMDAGLDIGLVGFTYAEWGHGITLGGIQTLTCSAERLARIASEGFTLVIWDEVHHLKAKTYQRLLMKVISAFQQGYTATPDWHGGGSVVSILGPPVYEKPLKDMIYEGYLAKPIPLVFKTSTRLTKDLLSGNDFDEGKLAAAINRRDRNTIIVETFLQQKCKGEPTLAFCINKQHARDLTEEFIAHGVSALAMIDDLDDLEQEAAYHGYDTGDINVLVSVGMLTEGVDVPQTLNLFLCAPTKSRPLHTQRIGRGTRLCLGKTSFRIFDFTDNCETHDLDPVSISDVLDLPEYTPGEDVVDAIKKEKAKKASSPQGEKEPKEVEGIEGGEIVSRSVNLIKQYAWKKVRGGGYQLTVQVENHPPQKIAITPNAKSGFDVAMVLQQHLLAPRKVALVESGIALSTAQSIAEKKACLLEQGKFHYVDPDASWRKNAPTAPQIARLEAMSIAIPATAGEAEAILTKRFARKPYKKKVAP